MCTYLFETETMEAERTPAGEVRVQVDMLMLLDRAGVLLSPFVSKTLIEKEGINTPESPGPGVSKICKSEWNKERYLRGIYVFFDCCCYGNSPKGFYYVRHYPSVHEISECGSITTLSSAYQAPDLIIQKSKLRPDQVDYMERKWQETREFLDNEKI